MNLRKKSTYRVLFVVVLMFAMEMLAVAVWAQEKGGKTSEEQQRSKTSTETKVQTKEPTRTAVSPEAKVAAKNPSVKKALEAAPSSTSNDLVGNSVTVDGTPDIELVTISNARNCNIDAGDTITFEVVSGPDDGTIATVVNGSNADINTNGNTVTVENPTNSNSPIAFFTDNTITPEETLDGHDGLEVVSSSIDCGNNNNNNNHRRHRHNGGNNNNNNNNQYNGNNDNNNNEDTLGSASINSEATTSSGNQYEDTFGHGGASASVGPGGTRAQAGGANAGRSPDQYAPETGPRGNVVNEVPTEGPLPNTGGVSVATGASLALVLFGFGLLAVRLVMIWREKRM